DGGGDRGETSVGITEDGDPIRRGDALRQEPSRAIILVVLHLLPPLGVPGEPQLPPEPSRAAVLRLQHRIATRSEKLRPAAVIPIGRVTRPRSAVRQNDSRQWAQFARPALREREYPRDRQSVARLIGDEFRLAHGRVLKPRTRPAKQHQL